MKCRQSQWASRESRACFCELILCTESKAQQTIPVHKLSHTKILQNWGTVKSLRLGHWQGTDEYILSSSRWRRAAGSQVSTFHSCVPSAAWQSDQYGSQGKDPLLVWNLGGPAALTPDSTAHQLTHRCLTTESWGRRMQVAAGQVWEAMMTAWPQQKAQPHQRSGTTSSEASVCSVWP
jgi:hypothetical protein